MNGRVRGLVLSFRFLVVLNHRWTYQNQKVVLRVDFRGVFSGGELRAASPSVVAIMFADGNPGGDLRD